MGIDICRRIELSVSNGIGYDSSTDFSKSYSFYSDFLRANEVKNTLGGLRAHLRHLEKPEFEKHGKLMDYVFTMDGARKKVESLSWWGNVMMAHNNQSVVDRAYTAEARKRGIARTMVEGFVRKYFGGNSSKLLFYIGEMSSINSKR